MEEGVVIRPGSTVLTMVGRRKNFQQSFSKNIKPKPLTLIRSNKQRKALPYQCFSSLADDSIGLLRYG